MISSARWSQQWRSDNQGRDILVQFIMITRERIQDWLNKGFFSTPVCKNIISLNSAKLIATDAEIGNPSVRPVFIWQTATLLSKDDYMPYVGAIIYADNKFYAGVFNECNNDIRILGELHEGTDQLASPIGRLQDDC